MRRIFAIFAALWLVVVAGHFAHERANAGTWGLLGVGKGTASSAASFTPSCGNSTTYFARSDVIAAAMNDTSKGYLDTFICNADVVAAWSSLDVAYALTNQNSAAAILNLKSSSYTLSPTNAPSYNASSGCFTLNGSSQNLNTTFNPSTAGGQFAKDSNSAGVAILNSRTSAATMAAFRYSTGAGGTGYSYVYPLAAGDTVAWNANAVSVFPSPANSGVQAQGIWQTNRNGSGTMTLYRYGSAYDTTYSGSGANSGNLPNSNIYIGAGQAGTVDYSTDCIGFFYAGARTDSWVAGLSAAIKTLVNSFVPGTLP